MNATWSAPDRGIRSGDPREQAGPARFRTQWARTPILARVAAILQQPGPFAVEVQRSYLRDRHGQKILMEVRRLLVVALHGFWCQLHIDMLGEEFFEEHRECFRWPSSYPRSRFFEIPLLQFVGSATSFGIFGIAFGYEPGSKNSLAILAS